MREIYQYMKTKISKRPVLLLIVIFLLSRLIVYFSGVSYDADLFNWAPQLIDTELLKHDLWRSLWYMHGQPPLYNLYNGLILQTFPQSYNFVFFIISMLMSLAHVVMLYKSMILLGLRNIISFGMAVFYLLSPAAILYEHWHYYSHWEIFFITGATFFLAKFLLSEKSIYINLFFCFIGLLVLSRSMFHLGWYVIIVAGLLLFLQKHRKVILKSMFVPLLLIILWYGKNHYLYGKFTASTWLGMNMARIVEPGQGIGQIPTLEKLDAYWPYIEKDERFSNIPLLQNLEKANGKHNFNNINYIKVSDAYTTVCLLEIKQDPFRYIKRVGHAILNYFEPTSGYFWVLGNREKIAYYAVLYDFTFINILGNKLFGEAFMHAAFIPLLVNMLIYIFAIWLFFQSRKKKTFNKHQILIAGFLLYNIIYVFAVSNLVEYGENNRFRFATFPATIMLCGLLIQSLTRKNKSKT